MDPVAAAPFLTAIGNLGLAAGLTVYLVFYIASELKDCHKRSDEAERRYTQHLEQEHPH